MSTKPEATATPAQAAAPAAAPAAAGASPIKALLPVILVVVLAPAISWAVAQFVILPQFEKKLAKLSAAPVAEGSEAHAPEAESAAAPAEHAPEGEKGEHGGKGGESGAANSYEFSNVVVNLSGTMGTRYLKTTFKVIGKDNALRGTFEANKDRLVDVTLNVLASLTLVDLEEAGARNIIREKLINSYNQALGKKVAEQVYFTDFVVQ